METTGSKQKTQLDLEDGERNWPGDRVTTHCYSGIQREEVLRTSDSAESSNSLH